MKCTYLGHKRTQVAWARERVWIVKFLNILDSLDASLLLG